MVEDRDSFCPSRCDQCNICKEMSDVFTELQDTYLPYQPVLWRVFNSVINKNNKNFCIEITKSIPPSGSVLNYRKTC